MDKVDKDPSISSNYIKGMILAEVLQTRKLIDAGITSTKKLEEEYNKVIAKVSGYSASMRKIIATNWAFHQGELNSKIRENLVKELVSSGGGTCSSLTLTEGEFYHLDKSENGPKSQVVILTKLLPEDNAIVGFLDSSRVLTVSTSRLASIDPEIK